MGKALFRFFTAQHAKWYKLFGGKFLGGGDKEGAVLVVSHKGAKSGTLRSTPVKHFRDGDNYVIVASAGGDAEHPGWYHNLMANPDTTINLNGRYIRVSASDAGPRRDELWQKIVAIEPRFAKYEAKTDRVIPIVVLEPR